MKARSFKHRETQVVRLAIRSAKKQLQRGFTLIELLMALAISAIIAALAYQAVSSMVNVQTQMQAHTEEMEVLQRAIWWMEQDFVQLTPRSVLDGLGTPLPAYQYREDLGVEVTRIAQFPTPNASGGLLRVGYRLEGDVLYRLVWPVLDRAPDTAPIKNPILKHVTRFEVRQLTSQKQWVDHWPVQEAILLDLPILTEVELEIEGMGIINRLFMGVDATAMPVIPPPPTAGATADTESTTTLDVSTENPAGDTP